MKFACRGRGLQKQRVVLGLSMSKIREMCAAHLKLKWFLSLSVKYLEVRATCHAFQYPKDGDIVTYNAGWLNLVPPCYEPRAQCWWVVDMRTWCSAVQVAAREEIFWEFDDAEDIDHESSLQKNEVFSILF